MRRRATAYLLVLAASGAVLVPRWAEAQDSTSTLPGPGTDFHWMTLAGGLTTMAELYNRQGFGVSARPGQTERVMANVTLGFLDGLVTVPVSALLSTDQVSYRQQIDQLGISPTYHGVTVHLGHFAPEFSKYTLADQTLLGGGFEVERRGIRVGVVSGQTARAIEPQISGATIIGQPQLSQRMSAVRVGYGGADAPASFDVIYMTASDNGPPSLDSTLTPPSTLAPQQNSVLGFKGMASFLDRRASFAIEGASSRQQRRPGAPSGGAITGQAGSAKLDYRAGPVTMGGTMEYVGPAFLSEGNAELTPDHLDYGMTLSGQLAGGRVVFNSMSGWRQNNLAKDASQTTRRAIYTIAGTVQPSPLFGVDVQMSNNINNSRALLDTSYIRSITGQYSVSPRLVWRTGSVQQVAVLVANWQSSQNATSGTLALLDTRTTTFVGTWIATLPSTLAFTLTGTRTAVVVDTLGTTVVSTVAPGLQRGFFGQKMQLSAQLQLMRTSGRSQASNEVYPLLQLHYAIAPGQDLQVGSSVRRNTISSTGSPTQSFTERVITLQYSMAWR